MSLQLFTVTHSTTSDKTVLLRRCWGLQPVMTLPSPPSLSSCTVLFIHLGSQVTPLQDAHGGTRSPMLLHASITLNQQTLFWLNLATPFLCSCPAAAKSHWEKPPHGDYGSTDPRETSHIALHLVPTAHPISSFLKPLSSQQPSLSAGDRATYLQGQEKPYKRASPSPCSQTPLTNIPPCPARPPARKSRAVAWGHSCTWAPSPSGLHGTILWRPNTVSCSLKLPMAGVPDLVHAV